MKKNLLVLGGMLMVGFIMLSGSAHAQINFQNIFQSLYGGTGWIATDILDVMENAGGFLIVAGGILAGIAVIWAGIVYMTAGSNQTRVASAKSIFKNGILGALILFAAGVILATIFAFATDPTGFFS